MRRAHNLNHIDYLQRDYLYKSLLHKQRINNIKPNDAVVNGGVKQKYKFNLSEAQKYDEGINLKYSNLIDHSIKNN